MLDWDRTHDWELVEVYHDLTRVAIQFRQAAPSLTELLAVRRCLPQFRHMAPEAVRAVIGESGGLPLGVLPSPEARELIRMAEAVGLRVMAEGASAVGYLPFDRTTGCGMLIENDEEAAALVQEMLAAGVPIRHVEA
jgi:hypothetical protein